MSEAKKSKTSQEAELDAVRQYLLECNRVPKDSRALSVALTALDQERKRMERDAKLQRKFAAAASNNNSSVEADGSMRKQVQENSPKQQLNNSQDDAELAEWQDVGASSSQEEEEGSVLGKMLARASVAAMANSQTTVTSPLAAIALALHAALVSDLLGFKCTGIPDDSSSGSGFAAPIRELPPTQLVPNKWDEDASRVAFRYRKNDVGSTVLQVTQTPQEVVVELLPSNSKEPRHEPLRFPIDRHVNVESLSHAISGQGRVVPTLHYKALPVLLTEMCNAFDLGPVRDSLEQPATEVPYVDTTIPRPSTTTTVPANTAVPVHRPLGRVPDYETPTMEIFQTRPQRCGNFDSDLMPGGIVDPTGGAGGNLMGPNHPMFGGRPSVAGGGYGMRPRFDPYGPPGGPTDPGVPDDPDNVLDPTRPARRGRRGPPGGSGDPNPDHERPPNNLSNNMFM